MLACWKLLAVAIQIVMVAAAVTIMLEFERSARMRGGMSASAILDQRRARGCTVLRPGPKHGGRRPE
jgi:hypothetical protein